MAEAGAPLEGCEGLWRVGLGGVALMLAACNITIAEQLPQLAKRTAMAHDCAGMSASHDHFRD